MSEVPDEIVDYVKSTLDSGFEPRLIKEQLLTHGYDQQIIDEAFRFVRRHYSDVPKEIPFSLVALCRRFKHVETLFGIVYFFCFIVFMFVVAALSQAVMSSIFVGFLPTMLTIVFAVVVFDVIEAHKKIVLIAIPLVLCGGFFVLGTASALPVFRNMNILNVTALNFITSFLFVFISLLLDAIERRVLEEQEEQELDEELRDVDKDLGHESPKEEFRLNPELRAVDARMIDKYIQSIEDKAKALNSVIGRVYTKRHGGTDEVRDAIKIPCEWYNEFARLEGIDAAAKIKKIRHLVNSIWERLQSWRNPEKAMFGYRHQYLKGLNRDPEGNTPVIDVLIANDRDPVEVYYRSAIEFCENALGELSEYDLENIGVRR